MLDEPEVADEPDEPELPDEPDVPLVPDVADVPLDPLVIGTDDVHEANPVESDIRYLPIPCVPSTILICDTVNPPSLKFEYDEILILPTTVWSEFVLIKANSSADSSQINAWVAPVPLTNIIPSSKVGAPL